MGRFNARCVGAKHGTKIDKGGEDELCLNINSEHGYCERMETNYNRKGGMLCRAVIEVL